MSFRGRTGLTLLLLFVYWLAFVWLGIEWAHRPGFVPHPEAVSYPVRDVIVVSGSVGLLVACLGLILLWPVSWKRWIRAALGAAYVLFLGVLVISGMVTDMPGIVYVAPAFALVTFLLLGAGALWCAATSDSSSHTVV